MDLFTYLMAKKGQNTGRDLFSYLLGKKASGGSGTYTTFSGTSLNISNTIKAAIKKFMLNSTELTQDGTPTPDNPVDVHVITGDNNIKITDGTEEQNYPITLSSKNLFNPTYYLNSTFRTVTYKYTQTNVKGNRNLYFKAKVKEGKTPYDDLYVALSTEGTNPNSGITIFSIKRGIPQTTDLSKDYTEYNTLYLSFYPTTYTWEQINEVYDFWIATEDIEYSPYIANPLEYCKIGDYADELIRTSGKNLFNIEGNINTRYNGSTGNYNSTVSNKLITTYSTNNGYPYGQRIYVGAGNKITISAVVSNIEATGSKEAVIMCFNDNTTNNYQSTTFTDNEINIKKHFTFIPETDYIIIAFAGKYSGFITATFIDIQVEYGDNTMDYEPYGENEWYLKKKVSKIDSYNGEIITTPYISTTGGLDTGATIYYGLATPTYTQISQADYPILRSQLENLYNNAKSYDGQTNITQTNDDLPFNISVDVKVANL